MGQRPNLNRHTTSTNRWEKSSITRRPQTHYYTWILRVWKSSHGTHIDVQRYTYECVSRHLSVCHVTWVCVTSHECVSRHMSVCHVTWVCVTWHECVWRRVYLHRPTATKTPSYLDPAFVKFESWYIYRCVIVHVCVCVTSDMSASPHTHKYVIILGSYMREKHTTVKLQMRHSTHMCVSHVCVS